MKHLIVFSLFKGILTVKNSLCFKIRLYITNSEQCVINLYFTWTTLWNIIHNNISLRLQWLPSKGNEFSTPDKGDVNTGMLVYINVCVV